MGDKLGPNTASEVQEALGDVLRQAHVNGVEISEKRWVIRHDDTEIQDWEVEVVPVEN